MTTVRLQSMKLSLVSERKSMFQWSIGYQFPPSLLKKKKKKTGLTLTAYLSEPSISQLTSSVGSPSTSVHWNITQRHITILNVAACLPDLSLSSLAILLRNSCDAGVRPLMFLAILLDFGLAL